MPETTNLAVESTLETLVATSQDGSRDAFGELYDLLYDRVYAYVFRRVYDRTASQDIVANIFYCMMTHLDKFRWQGDARLYAWVFRISMNEIATYFRKGKNYTTVEDWLSFSETIANDDEPILDRMVYDDEITELTAAVKRLPEKLRSVVELYYFANLSHKEIALTLGIRQEAARVRQHRAIEILRAKMRKDNEI